MSQSESKQERPKQKRRFSQEQYEMLKRCSEKKDVTEWNEWREKNRTEGVLLEKANLQRFHLQGADLELANLQGANLWVANLQGADLRGAQLQAVYLTGGELRGAHLAGANLEKAWLYGANLENAYIAMANFKHVCFECANLRNASNKEDLCSDDTIVGVDWGYGGVHRGTTNFENASFGSANLEDAELEGANLKGAWLRGTDIRGTRFRYAVVDELTLIWNCSADRHTDFRGVGLGSICIDPATRALLEYNIRRMNWEKWYKEHWFWRWPVQLFWGMSDYGMSTLRVVGVFFLLAFLFAGIYLNWVYWRPPGIVSNLVVQPEIGEAGWHYFLRAPVRAVYFSIVTMTTLGFGDMYANKGSIAGHVILAVQVIFGYVLLGALVTRFAVLFTAGGPAGKFAEEK